MLRTAHACPACASAAVEGSLDLGAPTDSDEGEPWVEDMAGEPSGAPNDEGEAVVLESGATPKPGGELAAVGAAACAGKGG